MTAPIRCELAARYYYTRAYLYVDIKADLLLLLPRDFILYTHERTDVAQTFI